MSTQVQSAPAATPTLAPLLALVDEAFVDFRKVERLALVARLRLGRFLGRIDRERKHRTLGYSSISAVGEAHGLSGAEVWTAIRAARAVDLDCRVEALLLDGVLSLHAVSLLDKAFSLPPIEGREEPDWVKFATEKTTSELKEAIDEWRARAEAPEPPEPVTMFLSAEGRLVVERAMRIAERKAKRVLSVGQLVRRLAEHFLDSFDPARRRRRKRRGGTEGPTRHVPVHVKDAVALRDRDTCRSPLCGRKRFLQGGHAATPHRDGGLPEVANIFTQCPVCNGMFETGQLGIVGDANDAVFIDRDGRVILPYKTGRIIRPTLEEYRRGPDVWRPRSETR